MLKRTLLAFLLLVTSVFAQNQERITGILAAAKEYNVSDAKLIEAINDDTPVDAFIKKYSGQLSITGPEKAPVGSPVQIQVRGMPEKCTVRWSREPVSSDQVLLNVYDADQKPVILFWGSKPGKIKFNLLVAVNGPDVPEIKTATYELEYGQATPPVPPVPAPSKRLQDLVDPIRNLKIGVLDTGNLIEFYTDFATVVRNDSTEISDTGKFRNIYTKAGTLMFKETGIQGKYAGMAEIVDGIISDELGLAVTSLDRDKAEALLRAIAWGFANAR